MSGTPLLLVVVAVFAVGTYATRAVGPLLHARGGLAPATEALLTRAALVLLCALAVTAALLDGDELAGAARPAGVLAGGVLAWRRASFVLVVLGAGATTAGLRLLGVA